MGSEATIQELQDPPQVLHIGTTCVEWIHAQELLQPMLSNGWIRTHEEVHEQDHVDAAKKRTLQK
eukprot:9347126-Heterocapsa_arctica.AAC.1